ncbi:MAG: cytochrome c biogenesis protein CcdA, partial [Chloroflexi bacterium]|nr:cytochrome c biogenesis protein CcdA [Chloroflexota bacterium]
LPLMPIYLSYLGGASLHPGEEASAALRRRTVVHALLFVAGFSIVFTLLGASAGLMGSLLREHMPLIRQASGVVIVLLGLSMVGLFQLPFLQVERRFHLAPSSSAGKVRSLLMGVVFGFGWTPCIGPILGAILSVAMNSQTAGQGTFLLAIYSAGLGIPFIAAGLALGQATGFLRRLNSHLRGVSLASGVLIVIMGILVFFNAFQRLSGLFPWSV